jgi:hypothetical protein
MMVHPRENELVVGTHGRSIFVADVKPLQSLKDAGKAIMAFAPQSIRHSERWGQKQYPWAEANEPKVNVLYYVGKAAPTVAVEIYDEKKNLVRKLTTSGSAGFQTFTWDVKVNEAAAPPAKGKGKSKAPAPTEPTLKYAGKGKYTIKFVNGNEVSEVSMEIR